MHRKCPQRGPGWGMWTAAAAGLCLSAAGAIAGTADEPRDQPSTESPAWSQEEAPLLSRHVQLTQRSMFIKAGEAYFDHQSPPRWVVFQAVPVPPKDQEPQPFYAMYVAKLKYDAGHISGIEEPVEISPPGSANTCGWIHPTEPFRVLFGSTLKAPSAPAKSGYQRGTSRYVWQFPDEMEVVERCVSAMLSDLPKGHPLEGEVSKLNAVGEKHRARINELLKEGDAKKIGQASDEFRRELDAQCPTLRARKNWDEARPLFELPRYDAECSYSKDGRFVLYAHVKDTDSPKPDADIFVFDTQTGKHHAIVEAPGYDGGPFFSPDNRSICYRSDRAGNDLLQLYVAELKFEDGVPVGIAREKALTANDEVNWGPFWHPSGRFLVYANSGKDHSNYDIWAIEVDWDKPVESLWKRRITTAPGADVLPAFSDDGRWMMWTSQRGPKIEGETKGSSQVWVAEAADLSAWLTPAPTSGQSGSGEAPSQGSR